MKKLDLTGLKFGRLLVLNRKPLSEKGNVMWLCKCDCGKETVVSSYNLRSGRISSCGCLRNEISLMRLQSKRPLKHGLRKSRLYGVWFSMNNRCDNPKCKAYKDYGGRGIKVCDEWKKSVNNFYCWAMNNGYKEGLTIDRINNDGNYEPDNCRWSTPKEQNVNKRNTIKLSGVSLKELSDKYNIPYYKLKYRYNLGWNLQQILNYFMLK